MRRGAVGLGLAVFAGCLAVAAPRLASASDERLLWDAPRVFSIQPRPFRLGHEFQLGLGVLPTDAFYVGAVAAASYTFHFTDFWAWEIAGGGYSLNFDTALKSELLNDYGVAPVGGGGERISAFVMSGLVVKPLFGKVALWNDTLTYGETFFTVSSGAMNKGKFTRFAMGLGVGLRLWWTPVVSWRIDLRDLMSFNRPLPEHSFFLLISTAFSVARAPESK